MSIPILALICAISGGTWIYNKEYHRSGGNTKNTLIVSAIVGSMIFIVVLTLAKTFLND